VAPALRHGTVWTIAAAVLAVAFLVVMVVVGALPQQRQLVKFEAKGIMQLPPERISRVALRAGERSAVFTRTSDGGWARDDGAPLDPAIAKRLSLAVQFMNTSGPVRVLEPAEFQGTNPYEFGLDHPQLSIALFEGSRPAIAAHFGGRNPDDYLQYVAVEGRRELFLLSRFVGQEWDAVAKATLQPATPQP
jgi:hypothetical protein